MAACCGSVSGFTAKEAIVTTMGVLANVSGDVEDTVNVAGKVAAWFPSAMAAFSFLLFNLLDSPCLAAIATMAQQMQSRKWFWFADCVPECICVCRIFERISDRYVCAWRSVHRRNGCRYSDCGDPVDLTV